MPTSITALLQQFNLTDKETKVYLATLELGKATVYEIANWAELKRPTTYLLVDQLLEKGLLQQAKLKQKRAYSALPPKQLLNHWKKKVQQLESQLPTLETMMKSAESVDVKVYQGKQALHQVYNQLRPDLYKKNEINFFGSVNSVANLYTDEMDYYLNMVKDKRAHGRELLAQNPADITFAQNVAELANPNYRIRFLPQGHAPTRNESAILGDKVFLFDLTQQPTAVIIHSQAVADIQRALFDLAWKSGLDLHQVITKY